MKVALAQISSSKDYLKNLALVREYAERAVASAASFVVFPEASQICFGGSLYEDVVASTDAWQGGLQEIADQTRISLIVGGFVPAADGEKVINQLQVYSPASQKQSYSKIHLYDAFGFKESDGVLAGDKPLLVEIDGVKVGLSICYDVRFPKLYAELARAGAQVTVVAASWAGGESKVEQWQLLTSARALDSQTFILAVDQADPRTIDSSADWTGPLGVGYSRVVSPLGQVLAEAGTEPDLLIYDLDLAQVEQTRQAIPVLTNAKLGY